LQFKIEKLENLYNDEVYNKHNFEKEYNDILKETLTLKKDIDHF